MHIDPVAYVHNGFKDKFGIPRQSRPDSVIETTVVFAEGFRDANMLRGIEGYSHLWLIWGFSQAESWSPTVRPPRLGGNTRMGVFATRSPFRPNHLGLSSVELLRVEDSTEGKVLVVRGADILDGTPIYDIKPYLSFSDSHPDARNGFAEATKDRTLPVVWPENHPLSRVDNTDPAHSTRSWQRRLAIEEILGQDPRPSYQDDPERIYKLDFEDEHICFKVMNHTIYIQ